MIGIILISHAHIAQEMKHAVEHILGPQAYMETLDVLSSDTPHALQEELGKMLQRCDRGDGALVFADMFGGTPCNIALSFLKAHQCEVISGFNLPALVKAASRRMDNDIDLSDLAREVMASGRQYICLASDFIDPQHVPTKALPEVAPYA